MTAGLVIKSIYSQSFPMALRYSWGLTLKNEFGKDGGRCEPVFIFVAGTVL